MTVFPVWLALVVVAVQILCGACFCAALLGRGGDDYREGGGK